MNSAFEGLREWDVPEDNIHYEAFGPATVSKEKDADKATEKAPSSMPDVARKDNCAFCRKREKKLPGILTLARFWIWRKITIFLSILAAVRVIAVLAKRL